MGFRSESPQRQLDSGVQCQRRGNALRMREPLAQVGTGKFGRRLSLFLLPLNQLGDARICKHRRTYHAKVQIATLPMASNHKIEPIPRRKNKELIPPDA